MGSAVIVPIITLPMLIAVFTAMVLGAGDAVNSSAAPG
jgi:hypothetical protein